MPDPEELLFMQPVDLDAVHEKYLKYAPAYAMNEAREAIVKVQELQAQGVLRRGIFYLVLVDLVGSTKYAASEGNDAASSRIRLFVTSSINAINHARLHNTGMFLKEIGDAVLLIFSHFVDVLSWASQFQIGLKAWDQMYPEHPFVVRTCVHIGEVSLDGVNPLSLGVSQVFKMEKAVKGGDIVLTAPAHCVAWPSLPRAGKAFEPYGEVELDGFSSPVQLFKLALHDENDLERMVLECDRAST